MTKPCIYKIFPHQAMFWTVTPESECDHEYDDSTIFEETDWSGSYLCLKCGAKMHFDVGDIGD